MVDGHENFNTRPGASYANGETDGRKEASFGLGMEKQAGEMVHSAELLDFKSWGGRNGRILGALATQSHRYVEIQTSDSAEGRKIKGN